MFSNRGQNGERYGGEEIKYSSKETVTFFYINELFDGHFEVLSRSDRGQCIHSDDRPTDSFHRI